MFGNFIIIINFISNEIYFILLYIIRWDIMKNKEKLTVMSVILSVSLVMALIIVYHA